MRLLIPWKVALNQFYLFQLEEYNWSRFIGLMFKIAGLLKREPRKSIVWTKKAIALFGLSYALLLTLTASGTYFLTTFPFKSPFYILMTFLVLFIAFNYIFWVFLVMVNLLLFPIDSLLKAIIISLAKEKIKHQKNLTIIGVAGSYGKTTTKETISSLLDKQFKLLKTPENINTPLGIAHLILKDLKESTEILIVEMGEYYKGDIQAIGSLVRPDIAVVTGINETHYERLGNLDTTSSTIFEIVTSMNPDGLVILNADDKHVFNNYKRYIKDQSVIFYGKKYPSKNTKIREIKLLEEGRGLKFNLSIKGKAPTSFTIPFLAEYIIPTIQAAVEIGLKLKVTNDNIKRGILDLKPVPHRLQLIPGQSGVLVIDDSYNANPESVKEALRVFSRFDNKRKVYITPGLVETGEKTKEIHYNIGKNLSRVADLVVLIKNTVTPDIAEGLTKNGFPAESIKWFDSTRELYMALPSFVRPGDVVLFQNDWSDNYI